MPAIAPAAGFPNAQPRSAPAPPVTAVVPRRRAPAPAGSKLWRGGCSMRGGAYHASARGRDSTKRLSYAENDRISPEFVQCPRVPVDRVHAGVGAARRARPRQRVERLGVVLAGAAGGVVRAGRPEPRGMLAESAAPRCAVRPPGGGARRADRAGDTPRRPLLRRRGL